MMLSSALARSIHAVANPIAPITWMSTKPGRTARGHGTRSVMRSTPSPRTAATAIARAATKAAPTTSPPCTETIIDA